MIIILISELSVIFLLFIRSSGVRRQESGDRRQETGDYFYLFSPHSTPHYPTTLHPTPYTPHPCLLMIAKKLHQEGNNFQ
ncbi:MAG: hypothetical protein EWV53_08235 [Microcystis panniformis Mp_MB_F_20051200_S9]|uniref:Uncharacterized protein n=1 Tax=Microcystis panniformis Mp_MB_F_20051200_S9 TaxID=2486223 RepID=A0A552Q2Z0_9CHRO|nr:MAG: hypothetical protein EWV42_15305 [Microcystis panniformis Mp_GB_SS_20050300_S99D]TRV50296.1 MAG: hypothetical protein EWV87_08700 [Microcystis panniformis Mp_GB_SS_20050300_S99]TRV52918.1 MAG: hypothetical protein EWV43_01010 [Microcystis panniformis Mp_MB_F_20080800_S26D]TRV63558.1 MAG: hypothetical protein EWV53_08235 [Microcystis panniformis Mp_MB_F_20051200_S9]TRV63779.1 MAG: hypothetical protein EWV69_02890 [Microcystis panniformis Mp_MB_F_20080800_S26]TRV66192.1 MAG: hypothetical